MLSLFLSAASLSQTHTQTRSDGEKWHLFSQPFPLFLHTWAGGKEATLCFHVTKHTEVCMDSGEVNSLIHHSRFGLSQPHLGILLSTLRKVGLLALSLELKVTTTQSLPPFDWWLLGRIQIPGEMRFCRKVVSLRFYSKGLINSAIVTWHFKGSLCPTLWKYITTNNHDSKSNG